MRLTLELLQQAGQTISPSKHRQLTLRGFKIPAIENLGTTQDEYEAIDLGDNDIIKVASIPPLHRLKVLILVNNRITRIAEDAFNGLPNLQSLVLTNNKLEKMVDIEPIFKAKSLQRLALLENPLTKIKHYRPFLIHKCCESLRILDFNRIKDKDRKAATALFAGERGEKLLSEVAPARGANVDTAAATANAPSSEVIEKIKKAIAEATTIEEVTRLEKALKSGVLPDDMLDSKDEKEEDVDGEPLQAVGKAPPPQKPGPVAPGPVPAKRAAPKEAAEPPKKKVMTKEFDSATGKMVDVEMEVEVEESMPATAKGGAPPPPKPAGEVKEDKPKEEAKTEAPAEEEKKVDIPTETALKKMLKDQLVELAKKLGVSEKGTKDDLVKAIRSKA